MKFHMLQLLNEERIPITEYIFRNDIQAQKLIAEKKAISLASEEYPEYDHLYIEAARQNLAVKFDGNKGYLTPL